VPINTLYISCHQVGHGYQSECTELTGVAVETIYLCPGKYVAAVHEIGWYTECITTYNNEECAIFLNLWKEKARYFDILMIKERR
jgi:hypothetical protein